tara:strand:+ start:395 stop:802 length:408 start_codon:yes stop_codon:yes gene_type:complete
VKGICQAVKQVVALLALCIGGLVGSKISSGISTIPARIAQDTGAVDNAIQTNFSKPLPFTFGEDIHKITSQAILCKRGEVVMARPKKYRGKKAFSTKQIDKIIGRLGFGKPTKQLRDMTRSMLKADPKFGSKERY